MFLQMTTEAVQVEEPEVAPEVETVPNRTPPSDTAPNQKADIDIKYISISMPVKHRIPVRRATYSEGAIEVEFNTDGGIVNITVTHSSGQLIYMGESNTDTEGNLIIDIPFESGSYSIEFENDSYIGTATLYPNK